MAALEASVRAAREGRKGGGGGSSKSTSAADRYEKMSKDELYELATKRDLKGRSKMSREQLADALRKAS